MVSDADFKPGSIGNLTLARAIDGLNQTRPSFLVRNIYHSLFAKQLELDRLAPRTTSTGRSKKTASVAIAYREIMNARDVKNWQPLKEELQEFARGPMLSVHPRRICPDGPENPGPAETIDSQLDWLPQPGVQRLQCKVRCNLARRSGDRWLGLFDEMRQAMLNCHTGLDSRSIIEIELEEPFLIPTDNWNSEDDSDAEVREEGRDLDDTVMDSSQPQSPQNSSIHGSLSSHRVRVDIYCDKGSASKDLSQVLRGSDASGEVFSLRACIKHIQDFQNGGRAATLKARSGTEAALLPDHHLWTDLGWTNPEVGPTALQVLNKEKATLHPVLERTEEPKTYEITYIFVGQKEVTRTLSAKDLACRWCRNRLPQSSFERLHFHYISHHDHFKFRVHDAGEKDGVIHKTIHVDMAMKPRQRASNDVPDEREMSWVRPDRPFDLQRYLAGDDSWGLEKILAKKTRQKSPVRESSAQQAVVTWRPRSPSQVEPIHPRKRKRYPVPKIAGVDLYRSHSKRKLDEGEMLSESDEDADIDGWAPRKQRLRSPPISGASRGAFFDLYDAFVHQERLSSDIHLADAIIRFCRKYQHKLKGPLMREDFELKLQQFLLTGLIKPRTQRYCLDLLDRASSDDQRTHTNGSDDPPGVKRYKHAGSPLADHPILHHPVIKSVFDGVIPPHFSTPVLGSLLRTPGAVDKLRFMIGQQNNDTLPALLSEMSVFGEAKPGAVVTAGTCVCGRAAGQDRNVIVCANLNCKKAGFHMECVNLRKRDRKWKCRDCAKRDNEWIEA